MSQSHCTVMVDLRAVLAGAQLPALSDSALKLLELAHKPDVGPREFAQPIEVDPGLASQVLRFANSSYFGFAGEISSVAQAVTMIGMRAVRNFVLWSAIVNLMPNPKCGPFELRSLWQDSLRRALFARGLGSELGLGDCDDLFAAALLQDMSLPLLVKELPEHYIPLLAARRQGNSRLSELERELFGWTHADASSQLAAEWRFPTETIEAIARHADNSALAAGKTPAAIRTAIVALSSLIPSICDEQWTESARFHEAYAALVSSGGPTVKDLFALVDEQFRDFAALLRIVPAGPSLTARCGEPRAA